MTGKSFSVWLNNEYIPNNPDKVWIKEAYSKAVKKSIEDGCTAFTRFFKHQSAFPNFKKKGKDVPNTDLWIKLLELFKIHQINLIWVKGHAENEYNNRCDKLAVSEWKRIKGN